jgi:UDP-glucose 6-dehydrogenase
VVDLARTLVGGSFLGRNVAVLGAAFKPNSDDVRDSPALNVAATIQLRGVSARVHDPEAIDNARAVSTGATPSPRQVAHGGLDRPRARPVQRLHGPSVPIQPSAS